MTPQPRRIVALGASNLTRGLLAVVDSSRRAWGQDVEVFAALGHGRSYGMRSRFVARELPAILDSGIWEALASRPPAPTRAVISDVGNDILYGAPASSILSWVEGAVGRLRHFTDDVVVAGLPMESVRTLRAPTYLLVRSVFFPRCRLTIPQVRTVAHEVFEGLAAIAQRSGARFVPLRPEWYGFDPIHLRPATWDTAWAEILGCPVRPAAFSADLQEWMSLYALPAQRQWILGREVLRPQLGTALPRGGRLFLY